MAALNDHERQTEPNRLPGREMAADHVTALLDEASASGGGVLLAEDANGPCGLLFYLIAREFGRFVLPENQRFGVISDLWVDARARRRGIATALIASAERALAAEGVRRVEISAVSANKAAQRLYLAAGYAPAHVTLAKQIV
ncbi:MAG: GNAT family N-acetyltransferase [Pseudomonadota bacterium]